MSLSPARGFLQRYANPPFSRILDQLIPFWFAAAVVSATSIFYARVFDWCGDLLMTWTAQAPLMAFVITPVAIAGSMWLSHSFSPEASGSGIPQLIAALAISDKPHPLLERLLGFRMIAVKVVSSCLCLAGGGVIGREGPNLQISAALFKQIHRFWPRTRMKLNLQAMILAGGAAGLASAFNTPLGGVVFAIEELAKIHLSFIRTSIFHSVVIAGLLAQAALGNYLYLEKINVGSGPAWQLLPLAGAALVIGALGASSGVAVLKVMRWRSRLSFPGRLTMALGCGLAVALMFYLLGPQTLGGGRRLIIELLSHPEQHAAWSLGWARGLGNLVTYVGGVVGGVFAPSLATGAAFGSWLSQFVSGADVQLWILAGMVAFLTGITRTPFTSLVLVLEMTDSHGAIIGLMMAAILAQGAAKMVDPESFYERVSQDILSRAGFDLHAERHPSLE